MKRFLYLIPLIMLNIPAFATNYILYGVWNYIDPKDGVYYEFIFDSTTFKMLEVVDVGVLSPKKTYEIINNKINLYYTEKDTDNKILIKEDKIQIIEYSDSSLKVDFNGKIFNLIKVSNDPKFSSADIIKRRQAKINDQKIKHFKYNTPSKLEIIEEELLFYDGHYLKI